MTAQQEEFDKELPIRPLHPGQTTGFTSPAEDHLSPELSLADLLATNKTATYFCQVGNEITSGPFLKGDLLQVDSSVSPVAGDTVVCVLEGEFMVRRYERSERGNVALFSFAPNQQPILLQPEQELRILGVVMWAVRPLHRTTRGRVSHFPKSV